MIDERPTLVVIPTELERADAFWDGTVLFSAVLVAWWLILQGVPPLMLLPLLLPLAIWTLTGEPAADVPFVGAVAAGMRNKLGVRRAHEWLLALGHWFMLAIYPVWKAQCIASYRSARARITR